MFAVPCFKFRHTGSSTFSGEKVVFFKSSRLLTEAAAFQDQSWKEIIVSRVKSTPCVFKTDLAAVKGVPAKLGEAGLIEASKLFGELDTETIILVDSDIVAGLDDEEMTAVLGHEIGHIANRDGSLGDRVVDSEEYISCEMAADYYSIRTYGVRPSKLLSALDKIILNRVKAFKDHEPKAKALAELPTSLDIINKIRETKLEYTVRAAALENYDDREKVYSSYWPVTETVRKRLGFRS